MYKFIINFKFQEHDLKKSQAIYFQQILNFEKNLKEKLKCFANLSWKCY